MSAPAWMPLYVSDYLADTGHLSMAEHGAYMLLIMHYWQNGGLPTDDARLARICRATAKEWAAIRDAIAGLFGDNWQHGRIDKELATASETMSKRSAAGKAGASARYGNRNADGMANAEQSHAPSPTPSPEDTPKDKSFGTTVDQKTPDAELYERGKAVLGKGAGGLIGKLLAAKGGNVALARAAIEQASTKQDPREFVGAIVAKERGPPATPQTFERWAL